MKKPALVSYIFLRSLSKPIWSIISPKENGSNFDNPFYNSYLLKSDSKISGDKYILSLDFMASL